MKDKKAFGSELKGSGTLLANEMEPLENYAGTYRCFASNSLGTAMTEMIQVIVERESHTHTHTHLLFIPKHNRHKYGQIQTELCTSSMIFFTHADSWMSLEAF